MSRENVDAIVLKTVDYSESSLIVDVFTREMGKVRGIAKGARRLKNPFETSLDLLASIRLSFIRTNSDSLDIFTEAKLRRRFRPSSRNFRGLCAGYYAIELLDLGVADYQAQPELWTLADSTLERFQYGGDVFARLTCFETCFLEALGVFPAVRHCADCGLELPLERANELSRRVFFDVDAGGVVCSRCRTKKTRYGLVETTIGALKIFAASLEVSESVLKSARTLDNWRRSLEAEANGLSSIEKTERETRTREAFIVMDDEALEPLRAFPRDARNAYRNLANLYISNVLQRRPRSLGCLPFALSTPRSSARREEATSDKIEVA